MAEWLNPRQDSPLEAQNDFWLKIPASRQPWDGRSFFKAWTTERYPGPPPKPHGSTHEQHMKPAGTLSLDEVFDRCGGIHLEAHDRALYAIVTAFAKLPAEVVGALAAACYIIVPSMQEKGSFTDRSVIGERHVIAFPEALFDLPVAEVERTILHEVAHFWLRHKPCIETSGRTETDSDRQEREADAQTARWLDPSTGLAANV